MTHRDEQLALQAKLEAQKQELDEARAENELLREAHYRTTLEAQAFRRALDAAAAPVPPPRPAPAAPEPPAEASVADEPTEEEVPQAPPRRIAADAAHRRWLGIASTTAGLTLVGALALSGMMAARAHQTRAVHAAAAAPPAPMAARVTPLVRNGTVATVEGTRLVSRGDACTVERAPVAAGAFDCRIEVTCNGHTLYGADPNTGFNQCAGLEWVQDPDISSVDGDPKLIMDVALDVVTVEDRSGLETQRVRIRI